MRSETHYISSRGTPLHSLRLLAADLGEASNRLRGAPDRSAVDTAYKAQLLDCVSTLERVCSGAAEMEMGADGFDNTTQSRRYAAVQRHLLAAAQEIAKAWEVLEWEAGTISRDSG